MKLIKINKIEISNFKGIKNLEIDLKGENTVISGKNGVGKTTIADSVSWVLFDKLSDGSAANKIRPHDINGKDIDYIDISVLLALDVDGTEMQIKKMQKQKWTTPRGQEQAVFGGNKNEYEVNGVPLTEKAFKEKISDIVSEEVFKFGSIAGSFLLLEPKKRREKLLNFAEEISYSEIINRNEDLIFLEEILSRYTVDEAVAMANKELKEYKAELQNIPVRIDELEKSKVQGNIENLKIQAECIRTEISNITDDNTLKELSELQSERNKIVSMADEKFFKAKSETNQVIAKAREEQFTIKSKLNMTENKQAEFARQIQNKEKELNDIRAKYVEANKKQYNGESVCPTCKQQLPTNVIENAKKRFEENKLKQLAEITKTGNALNEEIKLLKENENNLNSEIKDLRGKLTEADVLVENAQKHALTVEKEPVNTSELDLRIAELKEKIDSQDNSRKITLSEELAETERKIALIERNSEIDKRIVELDSSRIDLSQKIANAERTKFALEKYNRERAKMLTEEINRNFNYVNWVLFEQQINGGISEICNATIDGSIVGSGLNHGHTILANIDICQTMQKINEVSLPMFVDDYEALSQYVRKMVKNDNQFIFLEATKDSELEVRNERI